MRDPVGSKVLNRVSEGRIDVAHLHGRLGLAPVRVEIVTVTKSVGVVVSHRGQPVIQVGDLELHRESYDPPSDALVDASDPVFVRRNLDKPCALDRLARHR